MRPAPERITREWVDSLEDADLLDVEARLHQQFVVLDARHKLAKGSKYILMRGPADLVEAWNRWSRMSMALRARSLAPQHRDRAG